MTSYILSSNLFALTLDGKRHKVTERCEGELIIIIIIINGIIIIITIIINVIFIALF